MIACITGGCICRKRCVTPHSEATCDDTASMLGSPKDTKSVRSYKGRPSVHLRAAACKSIRQPGRRYNVQHSACTDSVGHVDWQCRSSDSASTDSGGSYEPDVGYDSDMDQHGLALQPVQNAGSGQLASMAQVHDQQPDCLHAKWRGTASLKHIETAALPLTSPASLAGCLAVADSASQCSAAPHSAAADSAGAAESQTAAGQLSPRQLSVSRAFADLPTPCSASGVFQHAVPPATGNAYYVDKGTGSNALTMSTDSGAAAEEQFPAVALGSGVQLEWQLDPAEQQAQQLVRQHRGSLKQPCPAPLYPEAEGLTAQLIRQRYPELFGQCPTADTPKQLPEAMLTNPGSASPCQSHTSICNGKQMVQTVAMDVLKPLPPPEHASAALSMQCATATDESTLCDAHHPDQHATDTSSYSVPASAHCLQQQQRSGVSTAGQGHASAEMGTELSLVALVQPQICSGGGNMVLDVLQGSVPTAIEATCSKPTELSGDNVTSSVQTGLIQTQEPAADLSQLQEGHTADCLARERQSKTAPKTETQSYAVCMQDCRGSSFRDGCSPVQSLLLTSQTELTVCAVDAPHDMQGKPAAASAELLLRTMLHLPANTHAA